jgi:hypothetical protein
LKRRAAYLVGKVRRGVGEGALPEGMVPNRLSASRKDNRQQNFPNKITESPQAMLLKRWATETAGECGIHSPAVLLLNTCDIYYMKRQDYLRPWSPKGC